MITLFGKGSVCTKACSHIIYPGLPDEADRPSGSMC